MTDIGKGKGKFYIVSENILPEAILKTVKIKEILARNASMTVNDAVEKVGLSRSAFYKYRDGVFPFNDATRSKILTLRIAMDNRPGMLANCITAIAEANGNILTINMGIPVNDVCISTIAFETEHLDCDMDCLIDKLEALESVLQVEIVGQS